MNFSEYEKLAMRTAAPREGDGAVTANHDLLHAALGLSTEVGEFLDVLKKQHAYGKPIDAVNLREELGDIMWYCVLACRALGITLEDAASINIAKLAKRYPDRFSAESALNRDLAGERSVLEGGSTLAIEQSIEELKPVPSTTGKRQRFVLGNGFVLETSNGTEWRVTSSGNVVAKTSSDGRTLEVVDEGVDSGPWLYAAQQSLNHLLSK